jgi:hypothetical protein
LSFSFENSRNEGALGCAEKQKGENFTMSNIKEPDNSPDREPNTIQEPNTEALREPNTESLREPNTEALREPNTIDGDNG